MQKLNLIDGEFSPTELKEVLSNLYLNKIKFHERKNFSSQERFGITESLTIKRIAELKLNMERLCEIITESEKNNHKLVVFSEIHISSTNSKNTNK